jgi:hypothetical protein
MSRSEDRMRIKTLVGYLTLLYEGCVTLYSYEDPEEMLSVAFRHSAWCIMKAVLKLRR